MRHGRAQIRNILTSVALTAILSALLLCAGCSGDDNGDGGNGDLPDPVPFTGEMAMPTGWQGIWDLNFDMKDDTAGDVLSSVAWLDTLCVGDALSATFGPMLTECDGYVRGDSLVFTATNGWTVGTCDVVFVLDVRAVRIADVITGAGEWRIETSGTCGEDDAIAGRELIELEGSRLGDVPAGYCP